MSMIRKLVMACGYALVSVAMAAQVEWMHDLEAAAVKAEAEEKLLLVEFTGSDWCRACNIQKKMVLEHGDFEAWLQKHCVPVIVDVPHDNSRVGGATAKKRNELLCEAYDVKSFPTLKIMSPERIVMGGYSGAQSSPQRAIAELEKCFAQAARLQEALNATGAARIQALKELYESLPANDSESRYQLLSRIITVDAQDTTGMLATYRSMHQMRELQRSLLHLTTPKEQLEAIDKTLSLAESANLSRLRKMKGNALRELALKLTQAPQSVQDIEQARELLLHSLEYLASDKERNTLLMYINMRYNNPAALYEKIRQRQRK
ncbi:MAG: thioredoxin family protein [Akkermansia sp.]|nr:thioredoxin family protein [Akkermansia sp.]